MNPRPTDFSNEESDRKALAQSLSALQDAVFACWDENRKCYHKFEPLDQPWFITIDVSSEFCRKASVLDDAISEVIRKSEDLLLTLMDQGVLDQHDPFYSRPGGDSYWPYFNQKYS